MLTTLALLEDGNISDGWIIQDMRSEVLWLMHARNGA